LRTIAQRQKQPQKQVSLSFARSNAPILGPNHHANPLLRLQRTVGNQAVQRMLQTRAEELQVDSTSTAASHFSHDFIRIPVRAPAALTARVGVPFERLATASVRPHGQPTLWRQPNPDAGAPENEPLRTLPPKVEGGEKTPAPAEPVCKFPSNVELPCRPKGLSDAAFKKTGALEEAFGFTHTLSQAISSPPEVLTKPVGKSTRVVVQPTHATPIPCESFFTKAGLVSRTISLDPDKPEQSANAEKCGSSYVREFRITPDGENKISEMEMEHCKDFKHAFDISIGCYAAVVNDLAKRKTEFPSQEAAVDAVTKSAGRKPDTWMARYLELLAKTKERDTKKWHTAVEPKGPALGLVVDRRGRCKSQSPTEINENSYPEVGKDKHPTTDVVK
jgi:hypothetical protein